METQNLTENIPVLIIDDDKWTHRIIERYLMSWGFKVRSAYNAFEGISISLKMKPALIFLDIFMPELPGDTALKVFRALDELQDSKIIIMSANMDKDLLTRTLQAGANGFISKPFTVHVLAKRLQSSLDEDLFFKIVNSNADLKKALVTTEK